jgi:hypothetical protein
MNFMIILFNPNSIIDKSRFYKTKDRKILTYIEMKNISMKIVFINMYWINIRIFIKQKK